MSKFTIDELDVLHSCVLSRLRLFEDVKDHGSNDGTVVKHFNFLEHLADKCIEQKIDLGFGQESLDDKI